ncbi:testis-specific protein TEX28 isoform X2 [Fukomys damarensis]|uniref:testis-specific protein TEX28 isoform X2 n=1 Tax=Fukomys damarensis TaxID=885580 RepID=UPI00053F70BD|nr:testis-specific protein TEX28 isoform X2 [Fukomys damarensis]
MILRSHLAVCHDFQETEETLHLLQSHLPLPVLHPPLCLICHLDLQKEYAKDPRESLPSNVPSHRFPSPSADGPSGHSGHSGLPDRVVNRSLQEGIRHRIFYLSEQLRVERASRDENTMNYFKLVANTTRHQAEHIWRAFERVNQRIWATMWHMECQLRQCYQQLLELEGRRHKGLALKAEGGPDDREQPSGPGTAAACGPETNPSSPRQQRVFLLHRAEEELAEVRNSCLDLQEGYQHFQDRYLTDLPVLLESLQEQRYRHALVVEQMDDHLQRHRNEIYHFLQSLVCTEEKMAYLSYEQAKEMWEVMEAFKSRLARLEATQQATQVEVTTRLWSGPREVLLRFMSLLLVLVCVVLACVSTVCSCPLPPATWHLRTCTVLILLGLGALAWQKQHAIAATDWQG